MNVTVSNSTPAAELVCLKNRLLKAWLPEDTEPSLERLARLEATEAEALSWLTPFPLLVFPSLLDEKLESVERYSRKQSRLLVCRGRRVRRSQAGGKNSQHQPDARS